MRRIITTFTLSALFLGTAVWAQDNTTDQTTTTEASAAEVTQGYLRNEMIGVKPQAGAMIFTDQTGASTGRLAVGFTADANIATLINKDWGNYFVGPSIGLIYSHLGDPSSDFLGANSSNPMGSAGANLFLVPLNIKLGYNLTDNLRLAAHGGGNVLYRSVASSIYMGDSSALAGDVWRIFPNIGADAELGIGKNIALGLRPDWTITPGNSLFTGTLMLNFLLS